METILSPLCYALGYGTGLAAFYAMAGRRAKPPWVTLFWGAVFLWQLWALFGRHLH